MRPRLQQAAWKHAGLVPLDREEQDGTPSFAVSPAAPSCSTHLLVVWYRPEVGDVCKALR